MAMHHGGGSAVRLAAAGGMGSSVSSPQLSALGGGVGSGAASPQLSARSSVSRDVVMGRVQASTQEEHGQAG